MASSVTLTVYGYPKGFSPSLRRYQFLGLAAITAGAYTTNGIPFPWALLEPDGSPNTQVRSALPTTARFDSITRSGNTYQYDTINQTLGVFVAGVELANGAAIPAGVLADQIEFKADFLKV